jgi:hypothetical protein
MTVYDRCTSAGAGRPVSRGSALHCTDLDGLIDLRRNPVRDDQTLRLFRATWSSTTWKTASDTVSFLTPTLRKYTVV